MKGKSQSIFNKLKEVWVFIFILSLLIIASIALLGSLIKDFAGGDKNVIALFPGDVFDENGYLKDYIVGKEDPNVTINDGKFTWENDTKVDLFKNTYTNANGVITVQGKDGQDVIAPGTSNKYDFTLKNNGNISMDFTLTMDSVFTFDGAQLPFYVRLKSGDQWLIGTSDEWVSVKDFRGIQYKGTLESRKTRIFTLEWMWPFETEEDILDDLNDTLLGNASVETNIDFSLNIKSVSTITEGAQPIDENGDLLLEEIFIKLDAIYIGIPLILFIVSTALLILYILFKPFYFNGFVSGGYSVNINNNALVINQQGAIELIKLYCGTKKFTFSLPTKNDSVKLSVSIKRKFKFTGISIMQSEEGKFKVTIGFNIKAIQIFFNKNGDSIVIDTTKFAGIDSKNNVYTPTGVIKANESGLNSTPYGLLVDKDGKFTLS